MRILRALALTVFMLLLAGFANAQERTSTPFSRITEQALHPNGEVFTFIVDGYHITEYWTSPNPGWSNWETHSSIHTITIKNAAGTTIQVISGLDTERAWELEFQDWNFDGYLDMSLQRWIGGTSGNVPSFFWLWDLAREQFVLNDDLMSMNAPVVDAERRLVSDAFRGGGGFYSFSLHEYRDGRFQAIQTGVWELIRYPDDSGDVFQQTTVTDLVTGEVTVTRTPLRR